MQLTELQIQELLVNFRVWCATQECRGLPYPSEDDATFQLIVERATRYGALDGTRSSWARASKELSDEKKIRLRIPPPEPTPIPATFQDMLNSLTPGQLRSKITPPPTFGKADANDLRADRVRDRAAGGYDAVFHGWFNRWSAGERPEGYGDAQQELQLTREAYYGIPAATALRRYQSDPAFARAVDRLFASDTVRTTNIVETKS